MSEDQLLKQLAVIFGTSGLTFVAIILYLFNMPDKFEHWMKLFYQLMYSITSSFPRIKRGIDKKLVAVAIQDTVNQISGDLNRECPESLPHALKIAWVKSSDPESFISKGQAVVRLKHYRNQDQNIVESTLLYLKQGFLPRSKNYLDETLKKGCEYKVALRIFLARRDTGAYDYFLRNKMPSIIKENEKIQEDIQILENLDSVGIFSRIFLSEVVGTGQKLVGTMPTRSIMREIRQFAKFLEAIAIKDRDQYVPLGFKGVKIKTSIVLVAKYETIQKYGIRPYVNRIKRSLNEGYETIYLTAWGDEFISAVIEIKKEIENTMLTFIRRYDYSVHGTAKAILMVCQPQSSYLIRQKQLRDDVREAFKEIVPEIRDGSISIMSVARIENVGIKVAVKSVDPDLKNPCGCCIGKGADRVKQLKERFPEEFIGILLWSDNSEEFIREAVSPLKNRHIDKIQIDEENLIANISVLNYESVTKALGRNGNNIKLACELTGYLIEVETISMGKEHKSPEDELLEILNKEIKEIFDDEIEIVSICRLCNLGSKVIVKWKENSELKHQKASEVCYGINQKNLHRIKKYFPNEVIHFHEYHKDVEEQICLCLFPLRRFEIDSVEIDDSVELAVVTLNKTDKVDSLDQNIALCEGVTGYEIEIIYQVLPRTIDS